MCDICDELDNQSVIDEVKVKVAEVCAKHPVYK
jgi:glycine hydroxymethyltransferase